MRLLLVDDDPRYRMAIELVLAPRFVVRATASGHAGLAYLATESFDAAVFDLGLPDIDGIELVAAARRARPDVPIVVLTITDTRERVVAALDAGAHAYVLKEHAAKELVAAIDAAFQGRSRCPRGSPPVLSRRCGATSRVLPMSSC